MLVGLPTCVANTRICAGVVLGCISNKGASKGVQRTTSILGFVVVDEPADVNFGPR